MVDVLVIACNISPPLYQTSMLRFLFCLAFTSVCRLFPIHNIEPGRPVSIKPPLTSLSGTFTSPSTQ